MRGDPLNVHVEATSAFEDAYNAMQHYADCAVWGMCEARWWARQMQLSALGMPEINSPDPAYEQLPWDR